MYLDNIFVETSPVTTEDFGQNVNIQIRPNPTSGSTVLSGENSDSRNIKLELHSPSGVKLLEKDIHILDAQWEQQIDLSIYAPGLYFIKLTDENGVLTTKKLIKM
jgi:hypothetical protein